MLGWNLPPIPENLAAGYPRMGCFADRRIAPISLMPQGLDLALTSEKFADPMVFLLGLRDLRSFPPDNP